MSARKTSSRLQRGQSLVMTILFAGVAGLAFLLMFDNSMLVNTKSQLQNAADAGAYSAGVLQARDHNFSAYTNRAMIANQVAVAQFVSLESFLEDTEQTHSRANTFATHGIMRSTIPAFAPVWDIAINIPVPTIRAAASAAMRPVIVALNLLIDVFDEAQEMYHQGTAVEVFLVSDEVVKGNDAQASVTLGAFMGANGAVQLQRWRSDYTARHAANDNTSQADRFADVVVSEDSTDMLIRARPSATTALWAAIPNPAVCPGGVPTFTAYGFTHFGATMLSANKRAWRGLDATMGAGFLTCTYIVFGIPVPVTVPLPDVSLDPWLLGGHGGAAVGNVSGYGGFPEYMEGYRSTPWMSQFYGGALISPATVPANYRFWVTGTDATLDANGGLQDHYRDVRQTASLPADQTPERNGGQFPLTIEVERTANTIRTSSTLLPQSQVLRLDAQTKGNTMRTIASAHAYFYRPRSDDSSQFTRNGWRRSDGRTEYENLFSPYWQARLMPSTTAEEAGSMAVQF